MRSEEKNIEDMLLREKVLDMIAEYAKFGNFHESVWRVDTELRAFYQKLSICSRTILTGTYDRNKVEELIYNAKICLSNADAIILNTPSPEEIENIPKEEELFKIIEEEMHSPEKINEDEV